MGHISEKTILFINFWEIYRKTNLWHIASANSTYAHETLELPATQGACVVSSLQFSKAYITKNMITSSNHVLAFVIYATPHISMLENVLFFNSVNYFVPIITDWTRKITQ